MNYDSYGFETPFLKSSIEFFTFVLKLSFLLRLLSRIEYPGFRQLSLPFHGGKTEPIF